MSYTLAFAQQLREKHGKPQLGYHNTQKTIPIIKTRNKRHLRYHNPKEPAIKNHNKKILQSIPLSAKQHTLLITVFENHKEYTPHCNQNSQTQSHDQNHCTLRWLLCLTMEC